MTLRASVVVPVHDKLDTVEAVLRALYAQDAPRDSFEVLVVDDHCHLECAEALRRLSWKYDLRLLTRREQPPSASGARNAGLAQARGERILLLDSDVVLPPDALTRLFSSRAAPDEALLVETYGSSVSDTIWEFHAPTPDLARPLDWTELEPLADFRATQAMDKRRRFDHLPAPWIFFWTTAVWIDCARLQRIGGFDTQLSEKGSEDIELGYRLHQDGVRFRMADHVKALHLPHPRDRVKQEHWDRIHERQMLGRHPDLSIEMLCAFDAGNATAALETFRTLKPVPRREPPTLRGPVNSVRNSGTGPVYLSAWISPALRAAMAIEDRAVVRTPLIGFALPDADGAFAAAVLPDLRGFVPEAALCRLMQEAWRVARQMFVLRWSRPLGFDAMLDESSWRRFDRPYWERSQPVSRSYYDWCADCIEHVATGETDCTLDILRVVPASDRERNFQKRGEVG